MAGTCECGNEPSGSVKRGEFLVYRKTGQLLKNDCAAWSKYVCKQPDDGSILKPKHVADFMISKYVVVFGGQILALLSP